MTEVLEILAVLIVGPMVGSEFAVAVFVNPIAGRLPDDGFRTARSDGSRLLGKVMPFWYIGSLALLIVATVAAHSWLIGVAAGLMVVVVVLSVAVMVPINNHLAAEPSRQLAARWDRLHWLRVTILAALFVLLVIASL